MLLASFCECPYRIAPSLCFIFNRCIVSGVFPDDLKCSKVIPLFKQGERDDLNNYRPISIIPVVAKVMVYDEVLTVNKLLSSHQSGVDCHYTTRSYRQSPVLQLQVEMRLEYVVLVLKQPFRLYHVNHLVLMLTSIV